jgi:hypothetical protein
MNDRSLPDRRIHRSALDLDRSWWLPSTADRTRGSSNLASVPRSGNISSDTRAGKTA